MQCFCDEERRILNLNEYMGWNKNGDYLYSMISDDFVYNEEN